MPEIETPALGNAEQTRTATAPGTLGALWGLAGVSLLLGGAILRLAPVAFEAFDLPWGLHHGIALFAIVVAMAYAEGYHGFQRRFSPRVAARARHLRSDARTVRVLFAPLFCMGFFHATRRRRISAFCLTGGIVLLVLAVRLLAQPWRGIVDAGVVVGLAWGLASVLIFGTRALTAAEFPYSPEMAE